MKKSQVCRFREENRRSQSSAFQPTEASRYPRSHAGSFCLLFDRCIGREEGIANEINGVDATLHHIGISTTEPRQGERFSQRFGLYTSDSACKAIRVQWHRFESDSPLHPLIRTIPHVALKVDDLERAIRGYKLLLHPYEPIPGFRVAMIEDGGCPIELVPSSLTDEELWERAAGGLHTNNTESPEP